MRRIRDLFKLNFLSLGTGGGGDKEKVDVALPPTGNTYDSESGKLIKHGAWLGRVQKDRLKEINISFL